MLDRTADLMKARRFDLAALIVYEAGKPWMEADADVSEAIDFCRFYAHEMRRLAGRDVTQSVPGEVCLQVWRPRGPGVVIAPWNFPLAILAGMTAAGLVAGNTVIVKPAEQTPVIAAVFVDLLLEAGCPPGVVNLVPGPGEDVGAHLVAHPKLTWIAFTGSRATGTWIWETAARTLPGQTHLKKVVCEMGGKNALIIDNDADLDDAIPGVVSSAFSYAGQKCSALSRLILLDGIYDAFLTRLVGAVANLRVGPPADPGVTVGPVIDADARSRILAAIERGARDARVIYRGDSPGPVGDGHYVPPTLLADLAPSHPLAREEIFGPVLTVFRAKSLEDAFALANDSDYALTGGIYSRSPRAIDEAREALVVGNLYINRPITGAIVERHPFGGFKMSGAGTKAGGRGYLENFLLPTVQVENTLRRGFTPPDGEGRDA